MLLLKVRRVKRSGTDYCLSVPLSILPGLNADFDGDILNMIAIVDEAIQYMFRKFNPITRMIIARDTGLLNDYFSVTKSQKIDLYHFATCGAQENDTPETFPEDLLTKQPWEEEVVIHEQPELRLFMTPEELVTVPRMEDQKSTPLKPSAKLKKRFKIVS